MSWCASLLVAVACGASPAEQEELLRTFRDEFIEITPGAGDFPAEFTLGTKEEESARPPVTIALSEPFAIAKYEVPQNLWQAVMGENPSRWQGPRNSVEMLSYDEAVEFCRKATEQLHALELIEDGQMVRLPTEAEWEYCCRAGTTTRYSFGDDPRDLDRFGWYHGNAAGNDPPVGAKEPNAWGLYDVHGYLWEWCADAWSPTLEDYPTDGTPRIGTDAPDAQFTLRGGSWKDGAELLTSTMRRGAQRDFQDDAVGLRCVLSR